MKTPAIWLCAGLLLTACSEASFEPSDSGPYEEIEVASFQAEILADDQVDQWEYVRAIAAYRDCLHQSGVETKPIRESQGLLVISLVEPTEESQEVANQCDQQFKSLVESHYLADRVPTVEDLDQEYEGWIKCLRERGHAIPEGSSPETVDQVLADVDVSELVSCHTGSD